MLTSSIFSRQIHGKKIISDSVLGLKQQIMTSWLFSNEVFPDKINENENLDDKRNVARWDQHISSLPREEKIKIIQGCDKISSSQPITLDIQNNIKMNSKTYRLTFSQKENEQSQKNGNEEDNYSNDNRNYRYLGCDVFLNLAENDDIDAIIQLLSEKNRIAIDFITWLMRKSPALIEHLNEKTEENKANGSSPLKASIQASIIVMGGTTKFVPIIKSSSDLIKNIIKKCTEITENEEVFFAKNYVTAWDKLNKRQFEDVIQDIENNYPDQSWKNDSDITICYIISKLHILSNQADKENSSSSLQEIIAQIKKNWSLLEEVATKNNNIHALYYMAARYDQGVTYQNTEKVILEDKILWNKYIQAAYSAGDIYFPRHGAMDDLLTLNFKNNTSSFSELYWLILCVKYELGGLIVSLKEQGHVFRNDFLLALEAFVNDIIYGHENIDKIENKTQLFDQFYQFILKQNESLINQTKEQIKSTFDLLIRLLSLFVTCMQGYRNPITQVINNEHVSVIINHVELTKIQTLLKIREGDSIKRELLHLLSTKKIIENITIENITIEQPHRRPSTS